MLIELIYAQNHSKTHSKKHVFKISQGEMLSHNVALLLSQTMFSAGSKALQPGRLLIWKHDKKSCPPSEVNIIRKMALTQFNLHYQDEGSEDVSLFASFIFIIHASFSCSYPCPYFWAKMFLAGQISRLALFVVFTMPFKIIVCHEYDYG